MSGGSVTAGERPAVPRDLTGKLVAMRGISKSFDGRLANDDIDFEVRSGEVHALLGENGAGKTTLMNILSGLVRSDTGAVFVDGDEVDFRSPGDALEQGIGMVHQHSVLVPTLTVAENVVLGQGSNWDLALRIRDAEQEVTRRAESYGILVDPRALVETLSADEVQRVEVLRLLCREIRTLILDEPTATLAPPQVEQLFGELRLLRDQGCGIVIVTHKLEEVLALADRATVLRAGKVVKVVERSAFDEDDLTTALVGKTPASVPDHGGRAESGGEGVVLEVQGLTVDGDRHSGAVDDVSFEIRSGQILGLAGVEGNGQMELIEALAGLRPIAAGRFEVGGATLRSVTPDALDRHGVAVVSGDRLRWDVFPGLSATENILLSEIAEGRGDYTRWGFLRRKRMTREATRRLKEFAVSPADPHRLVGTLSGGNQQRVVLARELDGSPTAVLAAYPTRGLDIAAARYVQQTLLSLRDQGAAILLISSDLEELLALSGRVGVLYRGRLDYLRDRGSADTKSMAQAMVGVSKAAGRQGRSGCR